MSDALTAAEAAKYMSMDRPPVAVRKRMTWQQALASAAMPAFIDRVNKTRAGCGNIMWLSPSWEIYAKAFLMLLSDQMFCEECEGRIMMVAEKTEDNIYLSIGCEPCDIVRRYFRFR